MPASHFAPLSSPPMSGHTTRRRPSRTGENSLLRRQLRLLLGTERALMWRAPLDCMRFLEIDAAAEELLGFDREECCTPEFWMARIHPGDRERVVAAYARAARDETDFSSDHRMLRRDGGTLWVRAVGCVERMADLPAASAFCGWLIDLALPPRSASREMSVDSAEDGGGDFDPSHRKKSALELQEARQELLRAAQTAAAGELVGAIGHDLRQPLSSIRMNAHASLSVMERDGIQSQDLSDALHDILEESDRAAEMLRVTRDLLANHQPMREPVDLNAACRDVLQLVTSEAAARGVPIRLDLEDDVPAVSGDPRQLRQALLSMVLNALETAFRAGASGAGITIATRSSERERVDVSVSDRVPRPSTGGAAGPYAVSDTRSLALVRAVAEAHYGYVLTDEGTSGSVVRMVVPVSYEPAEEGV